MSCLDYDKTWETMNNLEYTFNKIQALEGMVQYLQGAVDAGDIQVVKETTAAIADYLPKIIEEYELECKMDNVRLTITFPNKSKVYIAGA